MAAKKNKAGMDLIVAALKRNPKISYAAVKESASKKRLTIYPIMYGRAKALLGLVPVSARGSKKKAAKRGPGRPRKVGRRGPGRPRKQSSPLDSLEAMITDMKGVARDRDRYRKALEQISQILDAVV